MPTLHIEHPITDFDTWAAAFSNFAEARERAGVRAHRVRRPIGDPNYLVIELDFDTNEQAESFLGFLKSKVWSVDSNAPALAGAPKTMILEDAPPIPAAGSTPR
jgi:hypothetical protein